MNTATDSLVKYLSHTLQPLSVHWVRVSDVNEQAAVMKFNAVNVTVLSVTHESNFEHVLLSVDIVGSDERTVAAWSRDVKRALDVEMIPEMDFASTPGRAMSLGRQVFWSRNDVSFDVVRSGAKTFHLNSTFPITHVIVSD